MRKAEFLPDPFSYYETQWKSLGWTDKTVAKRLGITPFTMVRWRRSNKIPVAYEDKLVTIWTPKITSLSAKAKRRLAEYLREVIIAIAKAEIDVKKISIQDVQALLTLIEVLPHPPTRRLVKEIFLNLHKPKS